MRQSKKNQYISDLIWERDHFREELENAKNSKDFRPVWYLGENFTKFAAQRRLYSIEDELQKIETDPSYKPWEDEVVRVDGIPFPKETVKKALKESSEIQLLQPREKCPDGLNYDELKDWYKEKLTRIWDQLNWCNYQTLTGELLKNNIAFQALKEMAEEDVAWRATLKSEPEINPNPKPDPTLCPECTGDGWMVGNRPCKVCGGTGHVTV